MRHHCVLACAAAVLCFVAAETPAQQSPWPKSETPPPQQPTPNLDSLRLGANYLRWVAPKDGVVSTAEARAVVLPRSMSLTDFEALAEQNNPTLAQAVARVEAARGEYVQAGLYPNPRLGYLAAEIGDEGQAGQQGAYVGQEIVTNGKRRLAQAAAEQAIRQAQWAWTTQHTRVMADVRRGFYDVLVAQRTMELTDQLVRIGQEGVRAAEALLRVKEVARADVLQAQIEADSAALLAEKARNRHLAAWRNLAVVAGAPDMAAVPLVGELQEGLPLLTWNETLARALSESPAVAEARADVARVQAVLDHQYAQRVPNVDVQFSVQYDNATRDNIAGVQAGMPLPLWNRNQGNIRRAEAELIAVRNDQRRVQLDLQQRLTQTFEQYQNARCQVERYAATILPNAQKSLELVTAGYRLGEFNYVALLTAQRTFFQTNLAYVEAIRDLRAATVAIDSHLLGDSLQQR
jgi:outer membrane protein, heavy metal efflux system